METPNKVQAQMRVLENRVKDKRELYDPDKHEWSQHLKELRYLEAEYKRYRKMVADIAMVEQVIEVFESDGRSTEKLEIELAGYEKQIAALPTDERYEKERAFDLGMPNAVGAWYPDKLVAHLWRNERIYTFEFGPRHSEFKSTFDAIEPLARDVLARFRSRDEFEIPQEPGVCIPFGFIADEGTESYDIFQLWHAQETPYVVNGLKLSNSAGHALELLPMLTKGMMGNPFPTAVDINSIGPRRIDIGSTRGTLTGRSFQAIDPEGDRLSSHAQYNLNAGAVAGKYTPTLLYKLQTYANDQPPPPIEQAEADLLKFMKSFRPLPGMQALYEAAESQQ